MFIILVMIFVNAVLLLGGKIVNKSIIKAILSGVIVSDYTVG